MEALHSPALINVIYLIAASLFILGIKGLTHPRTAVRGNLIAGMGMLLAILVTLVDKAIVGYGTILAGMVVGGGLGAVGAIRVQMTQMPQFVALFNGFGGIASVLVAGAAFEEALGTGGGTVTAQFSVATAASGLIGAVTFWGSLVAYGKLEEKLKSDFLVFPSQKFINGGLFALSIVLGYLTVGHDSLGWYWVLCLVASVLGLTLVTPIGGADMPVVIALLNSYSGLAAASTGFILQNNVLIISGALVGASGIILTRIMCKAMNRSLTNVIFGAMAAGGEVASADEIYGGKVKATSPEEVAMLLETARRVAIVPGYGMAVAQ
ncbi:MAG: NAD(P)(+) transhydrogenase (Re/Si-specific) subunit beta, partial [Myxococcales bacterium]|nr:NAD(P)(+) transhydrogenase (Re/Si-specific) subunit beta [Myxococcales bacterium]